MSLQAWSKVSHYSLQGYSWVERNAPLYYSQAVDVLGPILEQVWAKSKEAAEFLCEKGSSWLTYAKDNLPLLIERLHSSIPDSVYHFIEYLKELLLLVHRTYLLPAMMYLEESIQRAWAHYVESCNGKVSLDCLKGQVSNISHSSWVYLQNATMTLKNWAMSMISQP
ncbi:hypothetical protein GDO86_020039 [Hymenochirus boettgeri]|uniref:Uncharacterized protein n=1 Tax=Hymenochirus boettgeri TaxID=247094 RepID=A0A8T2IHZ8_9PIPI|nr:hypothetical protein GDO86_020039 [Hymenochirus boettgeri]